MSISLRRLNRSAFRVRVAGFSVLLLLLSPAGGFGQAQAAGITLVQHIGKDAGTTTTSTLAFSSSNTAGNFIAVVVRGGLSNSQVFTISDSNTNTYRQAAKVSSSGSAVTSAIYYAENIKGSANTITVSMTVSGPLRFDLLEYSGVATSNSFDGAAVSTATSTSPNSGNVATTAIGDLLVGAVATADSTAFTGGSGYTVRDFVLRSRWLQARLRLRQRCHPQAIGPLSSLPSNPPAALRAVLQVSQPAQALHRARLSGPHLPHNCKPQLRIRLTIQ